MTTLAFLSLFFGLIRGPYPVELAVNGPAAGVELLVDGHSVQKLQAQPWKTEVDFGPDLLPHQIVARALDAQGHETARAEEWVNLPHPSTKAEIVLEEDKAGPPKAAKVLWTDVKGEKPRATLLIFDGVPLPLDPAGRAVLPPHDLKSLHILTAEVDFPSGRSGRKEVAYGGEYGSEVSTELTAVAVAGLEATTENRRRAVLLMLSAQERDQSRYDPALIRRYLAALRVPLFVWCVGKPEPGSAAAAWGKVEVIKSDADLKRAFTALREVLDSQRIVMVDGRLLPQSIALSPKASGVELAGATP